MNETGTIRASMGLNNKPLIDGLKESKRQVEKFAEGVNKTPFEAMVKNVVSSKDATQAFSSEVSSLSGVLVKAGAASGVAGAAAYSLKEIFSKAAEAGQVSRDQVLGLERATHKLIRTSDFSSASEGVDDLSGKYRGLEKQFRRLRDAESSFSEPRHPVLGSLRHLGEQLRGREGLFGGPSESELRITRQRKEISERLLSIGQKVADAARLEYEVTRATTGEDEIQGRIKQEQLQTEARIEKLKKQGAGPQITEPIQKASELRIKSLEAEESFRKLDIAAAFQRAQLTRPGIGLTEPEIQGAQLFRQQADIQRKINTPGISGEERARLGVQSAQTRNEIEESEFQQWWRRGAMSGRGTSAGGRFRTADEGLRAFAKYREKIQDMIRNNPELRNQLDVEIGARDAFQAPRQTQLMPSMQGPGAPAEGQPDIGGGRSLNDIYQLIDKKWQ